MQFLIDLIHWFFHGKIAEATKEIMPAPVAATSLTVEIPKKKPLVFDITKEGNPDDFLKDLQSLKPLTQQFEHAREELLQELHRLAPPRRGHTRKDVA